MVTERDKDFGRTIVIHWTGNPAIGCYATGGNYNVNAETLGELNMFYAGSFEVVNDKKKEEVESKDFTEPPADKQIKSPAKRKTRKRKTVKK